MRTLSMAALATVIALAGCGSSDDSAVDSGVGDVPNDSAQDAAVGDTAQDAQDAQDAQGGDTTQPGPPSIRCGAQDGWWGTGQAFAIATDAWGLADVRGTRMSAVDLDGDGWTDLVVRSGEGSYDPAGDSQNLWVLLNRPGANGIGRTFEDATEAARLDVRSDGSRGRRVHALTFGDADNDGDLDAFTSVENYSIFVPGNPDHGDRSAYLRNDGTGVFEDATPDILSHPFGQRRYHSTGTVFTDVNRDGNLDLFVGFGIGQYGSPDPDTVYLGDGAGGFEDATEALGLMTLPWSDSAAVASGAAHRRTWAVTACDLNDDGVPDLLGASYGRAFNSLWLSSPAGYEDAGPSSGYAADEDADWTTNLNAQCYCQLEPQAEDCGGVPPPAAFFPCAQGQTLRWNHAVDREPYRNAGNTFSTVCGDVDNDGDVDLLTLEIQHWDVGPSSDHSELLLNDGAGGFSRPGNASTGLVRQWDSAAYDEGDIHGALFDWDNDGRLDVLIASSDYPGTRAFPFWQQPDGSFQAMPESTGLAYPRAQGVAIADFDRDGDLDVILGHSRARCGGEGDCLDAERVRFFSNQVGQAANWTSVRLVGGAGANRAAIGARVRVTAGGVTQTREISGGYGIMTIQNELTAHVGLGSACSIDKLEIRWPDAQGTTETFENLAANWELRVEQGRGIVDYVDPAIE